MTFSPDHITDMPIKPGTNVKIVTDMDCIRERICVHNSVMYDRKDTRIILAQTEPPLDRSMVGTSVVITYLIREDEEATRYGFPAVIESFFDDYRLTSSEPVEALVVTMTGETKPYNIRMFYRVSPTEQSDIEAFIQGKRININDISLRGLSFSFHKPLVLQPNMTIDLHLDINGRIYRCQAIVTRTWEAGEGPCCQSLPCASLEFVELDSSLEPVLAKKIRAIERKMIGRNDLP